ncbi:unnamed protein product [Brassicogethes aeneus]|uniref:Ionotropic glutamate receptor C-terminal domain-containing protein n=1 Tax=Brassicogethes aeneus TaxID=1431903 RepID=A0A9P0FLR2_BRAAE|nr:unnamed protein product [Brassicogethes aeneus]
MKISILSTIVVLLLTTYVFSIKNVNKRALQKSHEKPQWQRWSDVFLGRDTLDQVPSLVQLIRKLSVEYLSDCTPVILYDGFSESAGNLLLEQLFRNHPMTYIHGQITENYTIKVSGVRQNMKTCISYILIMKDVMRCRDVIGEQHSNKVVVVAQSSQWRVFEFLSNERSQSFTNLLVITKSERAATASLESSYILYTHELYLDALGSSGPAVLTSWTKGRFARPNTNLFPKKITKGFSGHRFIISIAHQPPYVIRKYAAEYEILGSSEAVAKQVYQGRANLGAAGLYTTQDRINKIGVSHWHSQDCAAFVSLTSTALPRYRAILGPFHWTVWLALTLTYLLAIFPLAFSDKHTLKHLIRNPEEMENMFWYVFGTFTNCFTFTGKGSWSKAEKMTTRLLVAFYWLFTIIVTSCYTGSIIAFVTLPIYPSVVDTVDQLLNGRFQIGTLDTGGWQHWFANSSDAPTQKLLRKMDLVPTIEEGLQNTTKAFFWPYAFLGSKSQLDFIVRTNFTSTNKRSLLHISKECLVNFNVALVFPKNSIYQELLNKGVMYCIETGLVLKIKNDLEWNTMRSSTGKLLSANSNTQGLKSLIVEDRALGLDDTQGMFLLLAIGFVAGGASLLSEWLGGCFHLCKKSKTRRHSTDSIESNPRTHEFLTPRQKIDSIQYNHSLLLNHTLGSYIDVEGKDTNHVDCVVHHDNSNDDSASDTDFEEEINKIFETIFGEETDNIESNNLEEIVDEPFIDRERNVENNNNNTI